MTPESRSARLTGAPEGATLAPIRTGTVHGPPRRCEITGCNDPAMHVGGLRCAPHTFAPCLSREPLPLRALRHHVSGAIARGEAEPITERREP